MTMTIDANQQRFPLSLDHMSSYSAHPPHFTNPWVSPSPTSAAPQSSKSMYMSGQGLHPAPLGLDSLKHDQPSHHHQQQQQQTQPSALSPLHPLHQTRPPPPQQHQHQPQQQQQQHQQQPQHHQQHQQHTQQRPLPQQPQHPHHQQHHGQPSPPTHHQAQPQIHHRLGSGSSTPMASYGTVPVGTASGSPHRSNVPDTVYVGQRGDMMSLPQDILSLSRIAPQQPATSAPYDTYSAPAPIHPAYATSTPYDQMGYAPAPMRSAFMSESDARRYSQPQTTMQNDDRRSFADAIEASHGIMSLSQETPRPPIYSTRQRGSGDSYGFPSSSSSVSSTSFNGFYGSGSVDSSVSEYSTAGSDMDAVTSRALPMPRPQGFVTAPSQVPPPAQSMMGQFSSKMTSTAQKKHKCKVCDKRFTRPSSLQTHMYSHTGEKPFCCEVEGCGRHFSVVSNLRRHRKVHKDHALSETGSEEHHSE